DHQFIARQILYRLAQHRLRQTDGINVGRIDEVDALIEHRHRQLRAGLLLQCADDFPKTVAAERHSAKADFRYGMAGAAEFAITNAHTPETEKSIASNVNHAMP